MTSSQVFETPCNVYSRRGYEVRIFKEHSIGRVVGTRNPHVLCMVLSLHFLRIRGDLPDTASSNARKTAWPRTGWQGRNNPRKTLEPRTNSEKMRTLKSILSKSYKHQILGNTFLLYQYFVVRSHDLISIYNVVILDRKKSDGTQLWTTIGPERGLPVVAIPLLRRTFQRKRLRWNYEAPLWDPLKQGKNPL